MLNRSPLRTSTSKRRSSRNPSPRHRRRRRYRLFRKPFTPVAPLLSSPRFPSANWAVGVQTLRALPSPLPPVADSRVRPFPLRFSYRKWRQARRNPPPFTSKLPHSDRLGWGVSANSETARLTSLQVGTRQWSDRFRYPSPTPHLSPPYYIKVPPVRWGRLRRNRSRTLSIGPLRILPRFDSRLGGRLPPLLISKARTLPTRLRLALLLWIKKRRRKWWTKHRRRAFILPHRSPTLLSAASPISLSTKLSRYPPLRLYQVRRGSIVGRIVRREPLFGLGSPVGPFRNSLRHRRRQRLFGKRRRRSHYSSSKFRPSRFNKKNASTR